MDRQTDIIKPIADVKYEWLKTVEVFNSQCLLCRESTQTQETLNTFGRPGLTWKITPKKLTR